jgi:hypothetical protein
VVNANRSPEGIDIADAITAMRRPHVLTIGFILVEPGVTESTKEWLRDRRNHRVIGTLMKDAGYERMSNRTEGTEHRWKIGKRYQTVYGRMDLPQKDRLAAVRHLVKTGQLIIDADDVEKSRS